MTWLEKDTIFDSDTHVGPVMEILDQYLGMQSGLKLVRGRNINTKPPERHQRRSHHLQSWHAQ